MTGVNERTVAVIGLILVFGILVIPTVRADWAYTGSVYDGTLTVAGYEYTYISVFHFAGQKVVIAFDCLGAGDTNVDFVVCDAGDLYLLEGQYGSWEMQGSFIGYLQSIHFRGPVQVGQTSGWEGEFQVAHTGNWYYVFSNVFALKTKTVQLAVETYQWSDSGVITAAAGVLALGIFTVFAGVAACHRRGQR